MRFSAFTDAYLADMRAEGRIRSPNTEAAYRRVLDAHGDDVSNRDPSKVGREDVKKTLARWAHPNSRRQAHSILRSAYRYAVQEGIRDTNPADMVRETRRKEPVTFRPTRDEVVRLMAAARTRRERWTIYLGVLAGIRRAEMVGLQGKHFHRDGFVWVSQDIGKGGKERWIPVLPELEPIVHEIRTLVQRDQYVLGRLITVDPPFNRQQIEQQDRPMSGAGLYKLVQRVGRNAGLPVEIGCHTLRHCFAEHVARHAGLRVAQALMGHVNIETTAGYTEGPSLDEISVSVRGFRYASSDTGVDLTSTQSRSGIDSADT